LTSATPSREGRVRKTKCKKSVHRYKDHEQTEGKKDGGEKRQGVEGNISEEEKKKKKKPMRFRTKPTNEKGRKRVGG